jgi:hypothetical protein
MTGRPDDAALPVGAGLRQVIDAVWSPEQTGADVRVARSARAAATACAERYYVLPDLRHPRVLLPAEDLAAARRAVAAYRGLRTARAEAWSRLIRISVLAMPAVARRLDQLLVAADPATERLLPRLAELAGHAAPVRAMTAVRRAGPATKPTLGLLDGEGEPWCFAKVGRSPVTDAMIRNEADTLRAVTGRLPTVVAPSVVAETWWQGHPVTLLSPLPKDARRLGFEPLQIPEVMWEVAASGALHEQPLGDSAYRHRLEQRVDRCARRSADTGSALRSWSRRLDERSAVLRFGRAHGDWTGWNLGASGGRVVAWDWEQSVPDAPVGFDACHWYFQRARAADGLQAGVAAVDAVAPGLERVGATAGSAEVVAELYLLETLLAELESGSAESRGELDTVAELVRRRAVR